MRKSLLLPFILFFSLNLFAQNEKTVTMSVAKMLSENRLMDINKHIEKTTHYKVYEFPKLISEDLNIKQLIDNYSKDDFLQNYILYKIATTVPVTLKKDIDDKYIIKDIPKPKDNIRNIEKLIDCINKTVELRKAHSSENHDFIYFQSDICIDSLPLMMHTSLESKLHIIDNEHNIRTVIRSNKVKEKIKDVEFDTAFGRRGTL